MYLLFEDARKVVREKGLKNKKEWDNWIKGKSIIIDHHLFLAVMKH